MLMVKSAETQKWFDQNQISRSTNPISGAIAASSRAFASRRKICCGIASAAGIGASGFASMLSIEAPVVARSSAACFCAIRRACRSWRKLKAAVEDLAAVISSALTICPMPGLSSSASSAPRGSDAIAAIEPARGPKPKRCRASAAVAFASSDMVVVLQACTQACTRRSGTPSTGRQRQVGK